jgi:hypothetical protein
MKKYILIIGLLIGQTTHVFSGTILSFNTYLEQWVSLNLQYGFYFANPVASKATVDKPFNSIGAGINLYSFSNWNDLGYFFHLYGLFPGATINSYVQNKINTEEVIDSMVGFIIGPGYRVRLDYDSYLHFALGLHVEVFFGTFKQLAYGTTVPYEMTGVNFGPGGDIGWRKSLSDAVFLDFGAVWTFDVASYVFLDVPGVKGLKYVWWGIKPYVAIGLHLVIDKTWYLKMGDDGYWN